MPKQFEPNRMCICIKSINFLCKINLIPVARSIIRNLKYKMIWIRKRGIVHTFARYLGEDIKYYFADFVRQGGGVTPQIYNSFFAEIVVRKGVVVVFFFY